VRNWRRGRVPARRIPEPETLPGYWWRGRPNFGDLLTPLLAERFTDVRLVWTPAACARVVISGSILEHLPTGWTGIVAGAGKLHEASTPDLSQATVLGLRGPLTARGIPGEYALGDPGLIADELVTGVEKVHNLGLVPHWSDAALEHRPEFKRYNPLIIRTGTDPLTVIRQIGSCRKIVASSLHGLILADAFGIPRRTELLPRLAHEGGDFKYRDHAAAVGLPFVLGLTQEAPRHIVQERQHALWDMLSKAGRRLMGGTW
jgi:pyruvyltransferase